MHLFIGILILMFGIAIGLVVLGIAVLLTFVLLRKRRRD